MVQKELDFLNNQNQIVRFGNSICFTVKMTCKKFRENL